MKIAIMQPYFFPYIGYFQLISAVDAFIVYDNIKYTKKGWINRNRMLMNGNDKIFSLPLKKNSDSLNVAQRELAVDFYRNKLLNQIKGSYLRAPYFSENFPLIEQIVNNTENNLFKYVHNSIVKICGHLGIKTQIRISSEIAIDHELKAQDKVIALCKAVGADTYINAIGGIELYSKNDFNNYDITLEFLKSRPITYMQFDKPFVPWLSIIDILMFNNQVQCTRLLEEYEFV